MHAHRAQKGFNIRHGALFDAWAGEYDRYRPTYPDAIIDDLVKLSRLTPGSRILEVGCGTGKATVKLASRGFAVDCVDPGRRLIAFASRNCRSWPRVSFTVGKFEEMGVCPGAYDLLLSAQAFHWVEPRVRLRKAGRVLARGGSLALIYNFPARRRGRILDILAAAIQEESGGCMSAWSYEEEVAGWEEEIRRSRLFRCLSVRRRRWLKKYNAEEYLGLFSTFPDFLSLSTRARRRVADCIQRVIDANGGSVRRPYDCILIHARRRVSAPLAR